MKRILSLMTVLATLALGTNAGAASFGAGNIVIVRVGDGTQILTNIGNSVFLDEYTTNAIWAAALSSGTPTPVQTIAMPTNWFGGQAPLIMSGPATGQGALSRSVDGRFLLLAGYGASPGQFGTQALVSTTTTGVLNQVARVVGLVDGSAHIYTSITQTDANNDADEPRSAVSLDGTNAWLVGEGNATGGKYLLGGRTSMTSTQVETLSRFNSRTLGIFSNTLYYAANHALGNPTNTSASVNPFGGSMPTSFVQSNYLYMVGVYDNTITGQPDNGSPFGFVMFNLANQNAGGSLPDTLYVADNVTNAPGEPIGKAGGVLKYCYVPASNAWVSYGYIYADQAYSVTGNQNGTNVTLYITAGGTITGSALNRLYPYIDHSGYAGSVQCGCNAFNGDANALEILLSPGGSTTRENTRGIAFAPQGGDAGTISGAAGAISVGPPYGPYYIGPQGGPFSSASSNLVFSVANLGGAATNFTINFGPTTWLTATPSSGTLASGASTTVSVTPNGNANSLVGGSTYSGKAIFHMGTVAGPVVASPTITLKVLALNFLPETNFTATGEPGGPFTPSSYVYAITNQTINALNWTVTLQNGSTWASLSATTGSVAALSATNITVSINANANSLARGVYTDTLRLFDVNANAVTDSRFVYLQVGFGFFDDFSMFSDGDLVTQNNWFNPTPDLNDEPYQIVNGVLVIPGSPANCGQTTLQEPAKAISVNLLTNTAEFVYLGLSMTVTSAYPQPATWDFTLLPFTTAGGGDVTHNQARSSVSDTGGGHYKWWTHVNGFDALVAGTSTYNYGDMHNVFIVSAVDNSNCWVLVDPPSNASPPFNSSYIAARDGPDIITWAGPTSPVGVGAVDIDHFCSANTQAGFLITKIAMSTNFATVYNFLTQTNAPPPGDPFATWQTNYFTTAELANPAFSGPNADPLGKGISNTNQFLAGFNPTNNAAYPHIISIARTDGTNATVTYLGASGDSTYMGGPASRTNVLETTTGAANGSFSNNFVSTGITNILSGGTGLGQVATMVHTNGATGSTRYYRVRVLVP